MAEIVNVAAVMPPLFKSGVNITGHMCIFSHGGLENRMQTLEN
jgi:hypothetical protein